MGTDNTHARDKEKPQHEVTIDYDIAMSKYLVTVEVPTERHEYLGFDVPVRRVKWTDAVAYAVWKSECWG